MSKTYTIFDTRQIIYGHISRVIQDENDKVKVILEKEKDNLKHLKFQERVMDELISAQKRARRKIEDYIIKNKLSHLVGHSSYGEGHSNIQLDNRNKECIEWINTWNMKSSLWPNTPYCANSIGNWLADNKSHENKIVQKMVEKSMKALKKKDQESIDDLLNFN